MIKKKFNPFIIHSLIHSPCFWTQHKYLTRCCYTSDKVSAKYYIQHSVSGKKELKIFKLRVQTSRVRPTIFCLVSLVSVKSQYHNTNHRRQLYFTQLCLWSLYRYMSECSSEKWYPLSPVNAFIPRSYSSKLRPVYTDLLTHCSKTLQTLYKNIKCKATNNNSVYKLVY